MTVSKLQRCLRFTQTPTISWLIVLLMCLLATGCVSHQKKVSQARGSYWRGDFDAAQINLEQALKRPKKDVEVLKLDQAMVHFSKGELKQAGRLLREVRDRFDNPALGALGGGAQNASSYLTDDNTRPYVGEDHEKMLVRVMLTLIDLVEQNGDSVAYAHQVGEAIDELLKSREQPEPPREEPTATIAKSSDKRIGHNGQANPIDPAFPPTPVAARSMVATETDVKTDIVKEELAIAPLLRALIRKSSRLNQDDVQRNLKVAMEWRPQSAFLRQELVAAAEQTDCPPGFGSVYLIMFVGRGPVKQSVSEPVTSQSLLIADQILSAVGEYSLPPTIAPVKIAAVVPTPSNVDGMLVSTGGQVVGNTETIADLNRLAVARHQELLPKIIARSVVRRMVKKSVVVATKSQTNVQDDLVSTAYNLAGVLWEASEKADLRCWSLLPGQIQVLRVDLPVGTHQFDVYPTLHGRLARPKSLKFTAEVLDGQATFAVGSLLDSNQSGAVYSSQR